MAIQIYISNVLTKDSASIITTTRLQTISSRDCMLHEDYSNYIHFFNWFEKWFFLASNQIFTLFESRIMQSNKCQETFIPNKPKSSRRQNIFSTGFFRVKKEMMNPEVKIKSLHLKANCWVKYSLLLSVYLLNPWCSSTD